MSEKNKIPKETIASFLSQNTCFDVTANDLTMLEDGAAYGGKYDIYVAQQEWCTLIAVVFSKGAITYHTIIAPSFLEKSNKSSITKDMKFEKILDKMREGNWFEVNKHCVARIDKQHYLSGYGVLAYQYDSVLLVAISGKDGKFVLEKVEF